MLHSPAALLSPRDVSQGLRLKNPSAQGGQGGFGLQDEMGDSSDREFTGIEMRGAQEH